MDGDGRAMGTGELDVLPADLVVRSVGYRGSALPGLPLDERSGTVPHDAGRVLRDGAPSTGEYVAGWIKRGPTGVVGTNKHDARETVASLLADVADGRAAAAWGRRLGGHAGRPRRPTRCCSPTGGRSTPRRSRWARAAAAPAPRCTNGSRCWPPSGAAAAAVDGLTPGWRPGTADSHAVSSSPVTDLARHLDDLLRPRRPVDRHRRRRGPQAGRGRPRSTPTRPA